LCTECKDLGLQGLGEKASGQRLSLSEFRSGQTSGRPLLEKREKWRTPQLFRSLLNRGPGLYSAADVAHPPRKQDLIGIIMR
jgi:hypothetical protein